MDIEALKKAVKENNPSAVKKALGKAKSFSAREEGCLGRALVTACNKGFLEPARLLLPLVTKKSPLGKALFYSVFSGHLDIFKLFEPTCTPSQKKEAFSHACSMGHLDIVNFLLPSVDPSSTAEQFCVSRAAGNGRLDVVKRLLPLSGLPKDNNHALCCAAGGNHLETVKYLLDFFDPSADNSAPLRWAAYHAHFEIIKFLAPFSDPKVEDSLALQMASRHGQKELFNLLYPLSDPEKAYFSMKAYTASPEELLLLERRISIDKEKSLLLGQAMQNTKEERPAKRPKL